MIVKLAAEVDVRKLLGRHKWRDFMTIEFADLVMTKHTRMNICIDDDKELLTSARPFHIIPSKSW